MISHLGQRIDRLQRALESQPSGMGSPHPPLKQELKDLQKAAQEGGVPDVEQLVNAVLETVSDSFARKVEPLLARLRELAAENDAGQSSFFIYVGPSSDRLSDLRAFASGVNALVFQTEHIAQCKQYLSQLSVQALVIDVSQKKSALQETVSSLQPERFPDVSILVWAKKPKTVFGKTEPDIENVHYLGDDAPFSEVERRLRDSLSSGNQLLNQPLQPVLLTREELVTRIEFFKRHISTWSFGWLDASALNPDQQKEVEQQLLSLLRLSDIRGSWGERCYIVLLPHTDPSKAQAALEKLFIHALQPPVTPLRMAIVHGHSESHIESLIQEAESRLRKDSTRGSEPTLVRPLEEISDRTLSCLLLDNSPTLFKSLRELTRAEGLEIAQAKSVPEALKTTNDIHPYQLLIVTDELMIEEGVEWIQAFRQTPASSRMPILLISDPLPAEKANTLYAVGVTHILHRPIDAKRLAETIYVLLAIPAKKEGSTPPGVLCASEESKALLSISMVLHRETGLPLRLSRGWKDALNRLYQDSPKLVLMDIQNSPEDALTFIKTSRDFEVSPERGFLIILKSEHHAYREALESFDNVTLLDGPLDPQDIPAHVRIKLKLAPLRRYPPDDKRFQMEVSRVMQSS